MVTDSNAKLEAEAKKFNNPLGATSEIPLEEDKNSSILEEVKDEEYDEYRDDDFEQASQTSVTMNNQVSQSGLPPLASGKISRSQVFGSATNEESQPTTSL